MVKMLNLHYQEGGSWGVVGRAFAQALSRRLPVALLDPPVMEEETTPEFTDFRKSSPSPDPDAITLNLGEWRKSGMLPGRLVISYVAWETSRIPEPHLGVLRKLEWIWVPSRWQKQLMVRNGLEGCRIEVVPLGFDPEVFHPPAVPRARAKPFRFLFVGKWEERKGIGLLLEAFTEEFGAEEPVELVLAAQNRFLNGFDPADALRAWLEERGKDPVWRGRVRCLPHLGTEALACAYREADTFVLPTRAEGWGLPLLEAMATGLPCIVTGYSGLTEFAEPGSALFLKKSWFGGRVRDPIFFDPALDWGRWAQPSVPHLRRLMRRLQSCPEVGRTLGMRAARRVRQKWTWDHAAEKACRALVAWKPAY
jgi:glycosyltransferase involved in cell wall biosynthesis